MNTLAHLVVFTVTATVVIAAGDSSFIRTTLQEHFSQARHHVSNPGYKLKSREFISNEFKKYGLETHEHNFTGENEVAAVNVIGIHRGATFNTSDDKVFGIGAHYDTMRNTTGVDDNGSAMAALLIAAKALSTSQRNYTIMFVAFDLEEWEEDADKACSETGCGSEAFITSWIPTYWATPPVFAGFIVMDTIMNFNETQKTQVLPAPDHLSLLFPNTTKSIASDNHQGDFLACISRGYDAPLVRVFEEAFKQSGEAKFELEVFVIKYLQEKMLSANDAETYSVLLRSDHARFWKKGITAIFLTDTANYRGYMSTCYHQLCDNMSRITDDMIMSVAKTARALVATGNKMAPPLPGDVGSAERFGMSSLMWLLVIIPVLTYI